jgi:hypothetical protein
MKIMNIYLISQKENDIYDCYDSAVVAAESEDDARSIHPDGRKNWDGIDRADPYGDWCSKEYVKVKLIGKAEEGITGVICASYINAG